MTPNLASGPTETARHGGWPRTHSSPCLRTWAARQWLALVLGLLLAIPGPALAGFDEGMAAAKGGDYRAAYEIWLPLATAGDNRAQYNLAVLYDRGIGVPQDYAEAANWFLVAAEGGHLDAQANLGFVYEQGHGVVQNHGEAAKWYRAAAERGDVAAQANLGTLYANGWGVARDDVLAHMWLNLAVSGAQGRKFRRGLTRRRDNVAQRLTPEQILEAQRLAREWRPKASQY